MKKITAYLFSIVFFLAAAGCSVPETADDYPVAKKADLKYPYKAPLEKEHKITGNYKRIQKGMQSDEIVQILGEPDEINYVYNNEDDIKNGIVSGITYTYIIQRLSEKGSFAERREKSLRINIDTDKKVLSIERLGIK